MDRAAGVRSVIGPLNPRAEGVAELIHDIFQRSYREEARLIAVAVFPPLLRSLHDIRTAPTRFLGNWVDSKLAAVLEYAVDSAHLDIENLAVDPDYFRRGLASQLVEAVLVQPGWTSATVATAVANEPALALYRRFGFVECSRRATPEGIDIVSLRRERSA